MSDDWRDQLRKLRERLSEDSKPVQSRPEFTANSHPGSGSTEANRIALPSDKIPTAVPLKAAGSATRVGTDGRTPPIDAILGIDFGTRFTKVALSLPHIDRREILTFGSKATRLLPSRVTIGDDRVFAIGLSPKSTSRQIIEYLKIWLADPNGEAFGTSMLVGSVPLPRAIKSLCAYYLANILRLGVAAAQAALPAELTTDRPVNWFANIGVPAKYCDSDALDVFREVVRVAWVWHERKPDNPLATDLMDDYARTLTAIGDREMRVDTAPELAAALVHFAEHRNTPEGLYAFFDVGGGTVDGSVFRLTRKPDGIRFDILSANVDEIGTMAIARRLVAQAYLQMDEIVEKPVIFGGEHPTPSSTIPKKLEERIQTFFTSVMGDAKKKLPGLLFGNLSDSLQARSGLNRPPKPTVPVFMAGGGAGSEWYRKLFYRTHTEYNHESSLGIGGYKIATVPPPIGIVDEQYPRFVVALGLTSGSLHFDKYRLPSRFQTAQPLPPRTSSAIPYTDTKDLV